MLKCCNNCKHFHWVHEFIDDNGNQNWFDSLPNLKDNNGIDISINAYRCTKFSDFGDLISDEQRNKVNVCTEFEKID